MGRRTTTKKTNGITSENVNLLHGFYKKEVYTDKDLIDLFNLKDKKTLRTYRNEGKLGYSKVGRTILYSPLDIINFMLMNHYEPYQSEVVS
jgi:hypothetical protein